MDESKNLQETKTPQCFKFYRKLNINDYKNLYHEFESTIRSRKNSVTARESSSNERKQIVIDTAPVSQSKGTLKSCLSNKNKLNKALSEKEFYDVAICNKSAETKPQKLGFNTQSIFSRSSRLDSFTNTAGYHSQRKLENKGFAEKLNKFKAELNETKRKGNDIHPYYYSGTRKQNSKNSSDKNCIFISRRSVSKVNETSEEQTIDEVRIKPAEILIDKVTTIFDANYNDLDMEYSIDERSSIESKSASQKVTSKQINSCSNNKSPSPCPDQSSNNKMMQFMKSQIQEVRNEFMGALKELISN